MVAAPHKSSAPRKDTGEKLIASNPTARSNYFIEEVIEAGIALTGTEVKSLRSQTPNIRDAFVEVTGRVKLEAWLLNAHIAPYTHGNIWNHDPLRRRKLLLHKQEIQKLETRVQTKGETLVPLRVYFKDSRAKVELALGTGKKSHDKRQAIKERETGRELDRSMRRFKH